MTPTVPMTLPTSTPTNAPTKRWWRYVARKRLVCSAGHHFKNDWHPLETGLIQCDRWIELEKRQCGLWIFVFVIRGGKAVIAEVSQAETSQLSELTTPAEVIDYLGIFDHISGPDAAAAIARPPAGPPGHHHDRR